LKLTFLGAAHEVTGSCTLLEACGHRILIDCGMEQGADIYQNCELPVAPGELDVVLLTHAHIDHSGKLPALTAGGFRGPIYATGATTRLCKIMLMDSAHIQEFEAEWRNRKAKRSGGETYSPVYTAKDVEKTLPLFRSCSYGDTYLVCDGVEIRFLDAGHLLGSSSIEVVVTENGTQKILLFSGDIGNINRPLIRNPQKPERADYVVIESTYGNRLHGERKDYVSQLAGVIQRTFDRGGNVVIPSFAIGRTQELLYLIREIKQRGLVHGHPGFPVWVDSPLAVEATSIYDDDGEMMEYYDEQTLQLLHSGEPVLRFPGLNTSVTSDDSKAINADKSSKVILSASGMCEAGRIRHHLKHNLWRAESTILFVGYQAEGTLGRILLDGAKSVKLFGEPIQISAQIETMDGISGHADRDMLLEWLGNLKKPPEQVFVNHGEDTVCDMFAQTIGERLNFPALAPYNGAAFDLLTGECLSRGNAVKREKAVRRVPVSPVFERLLAAGKRLLSVIERNRGGANKDLAKFADQIDALSDKWDR
jgi:metallo-beta-lactamase family protein